MDQTATVNCDFPESAQWVSLVDAKDDVPTFNIQNVVSYFIERKAKDNESNKDYKNISNKAFGLFRHGHIQNWKSLGTTMTRYIFDVTAYLK